MKETFWKDEYGGLTGKAVAVIVIGIFLFVMGIVTGLVAISNYYAVQAFNRIHGTDYAFAEWFWAQYTIKEYHLGTVENKNYQIDLNINKLGGE